MDQFQFDVFDLQQFDDLQQHNTSYNSHHQSQSNDSSKEVSRLSPTPMSIDFSDDLLSPQSNTTWNIM
jgi:hypothetical protein